MMRVRRTALRLARLRLLSGDGRARPRLRRGGARAGSGSRRNAGASTSPSRFRSSAATCGARTTSSRRSCASTATTGCRRGCRRRRRPAGTRSRSGRSRSGWPTRAVAGGLFETVNYPFVDRDADEAAFGDWLRLTETALEPLSIRNPLRRVPPAPSRDAASGAARRRRRATSATARPAVGLFEIGRAFGSQGESDRPESYESRRFAFALAGERRPHWSVPEQSRAADFFDAKGLVERLVAPWIPAEELVWKPASIQAFTLRASAIAHTRSGEHRRRRRPRLGVRARAARSAALPFSRARSWSGSLPLDAAPVRLPAVLASCRRSSRISRSRSRRISRGRRVEKCVRELGLADLESLRCVDRYEGEGVAAGSVKTTIRLTFRSPERTLSQEEVNRHVQKLAEELGRLRRLVRLGSGGEIGAASS